MTNYDTDAGISEQSDRLFSDASAREFETNMIVFFSTLISTSRISILFLVNRCLRRRISPLFIGLINVFVKTMCLALFDFRIIHVGGSSHAVRLGMLFADMASFAFEEGHTAFVENY